MSKPAGATSKPYVCPLCEAGCGLLVDLEGGRPVGVRPHEADSFSAGYVCPKGLEILNLDADPDRIRTPLKKDADGTFSPIGWDDALALAGERLSAIRAEHGADANAVYFGTVGVHKHGAGLVRGALIAALGTKNVYGASSQDTGARFVTCSAMYGSAFSIAVPDLERTDYLMCIGANPLASNGSLMTAPDVRGRLRAILDRGGRIVVVDPRRTETAKMASEFVSIVPGTDAAFLLAMLKVLVDAGRVRRDRLAAQGTGFEAIEAKLSAFAPQRVAAWTGIDAETIERLALELADAPTSVVYSRMGPGNAEHSTASCYAVELLNAALGRLDAPGGAMFPTPAIDLTRLARLTKADGFGRYTSRVRSLPEVVGELPSTTLADEIETEGEGQVRGLVTFAGNPVQSVPNGRRIARALEKLDFMVSVDIYLNETTRHADLVLPPAPALADDHVDLFFGNMRVRNGVRWVPEVIERGPDERLDWEILSALTKRLGGGPTAMPAVDKALAALGIEVTPDAVAQFALRTGPYGDRFLPFGKGLNKKKLLAMAGGVDLGPLVPSLDRRVFFSGGVRFAPEALLGAVDAVAAAIAAEPSGALRLIGRRHLRSNNSWMHNLPGLVSGRPRDALLVHPDDAARLGLADGERARMRSRIHEGEVRVEISDEVRPGVVSLPHGYGHGAVRDHQAVAGALSGVCANDWIDDEAVEPISGQSILNGVRVEVEPIRIALPRSTP